MPSIQHLLWQMIRYAQRLYWVDTLLWLFILDLNGTSSGDRDISTPLYGMGGIGVFSKEVHEAVLDGRADAGLAIRAVARQLRLDFVPLYREPYDLVMRRRDYFEPPVQRLLAFARGEAARDKATDLAGYDLSVLGAVRYNGP